MRPKARDEPPARDTPDGAQQRAFGTFGHSAPNARTLTTQKPICAFPRGAGKIGLKLGVEVEQNVISLQANKICDQEIPAPKNLEPKFTMPQACSLEKCCQRATLFAGRKKRH